RPAVGPRTRRQRRQIVEGHRGATPLRHHLTQNHPHRGIRPRRAARDILYAGPYGRGVLVLFHKQTTRHGRPKLHRCSPQLLDIPSPSFKGTSHSVISIRIRNTTHPTRSTTQRETVTVVPRRLSGQIRIVDRARGS